MRQAKQSALTLAAMAAVLVAAAGGGTARANGAGGGDGKKPAGTRKTSSEPGWLAWETLRKEKDGTIEVRYRTRGAGSNVWTWQFRSTFARAARVDYALSVFDRRGRPAQRNLIVHIAPNGRTGEISAVSRMEPFLSVQQVRVTR